VVDHADWLWGWDPTPGIVSVWAEGDGRVHIWRRIGGALVHEQQSFRPWVLVDRIDGLDARVTTRELAGEGALRFVVRADTMQTLNAAIVQAASRWRGHAIGHIRDLDDSVLVLPPEEQYLVASGRTYFRDLAFDDLRRVQIDLETTGLDPQRDRIFMIALRAPDGAVEILDHADEAELIRALVARIGALDPDVIENHNLHGFDLPFLDRRAKRCGVPLALGRVGPPGLRQRGARRGAVQNDAIRRIRFIAPGRELIDTLDAVLRHDFASRDLPGHGLKAVARHFGIAAADRELVPRDQIHDLYQRDPERVRRYARQDVEEVAALARMMSGAVFALARIAPRRYERLADAGAATGILDPLLVRAYMRAGQALPAHAPGDGTQHSGAALHLFAAGVAHRVVKADVASLYPTLMREYQIGPARDRLGVLLALIDRLVDERLAAKAAAKTLPAGSPERFAHEAVSAAMKLVVNSAYGYLGAGGLTRFSDIHAANEVTRRGRETLALMCRELARRGVTLLEADTDGVYFAVPATWTADDERRVVAEVDALLPSRVQLELEGRYAAMLSHEPKNYALQTYDGTLVLRGVAFRSSRAERFGETFLRTAIARLFEGDVAGVRAAYLDMVLALRRRAIATREVTSRVRLTKAPAQYFATRTSRQELAYEAVLANGRTSWSVGEHVRVYRTLRGGGRMIEDDADHDAVAADPRDYDVEHYVRVLRDNFASRLARAFAPDDYAAVFADPDQLTLFAPSLAGVRPILTRVLDDE
jgi:DNA polymerase elongation subunit (family B)